MPNYYKKVKDELIKISENEFDLLTKFGTFKVWHSEGLTHICQ